MWIPCFGSYYLTTTWICNIMLQAPTLARTCEISHWLPCSSDGRSDGRTVTWLPKFLGWIDNQIFLEPQLRYNFILGGKLPKSIAQHFSSAIGQLFSHDIALLSLRHTTWLLLEKQSSFQLFIENIYQAIVSIEEFNNAETSCRIARILVISPSDEQSPHWNISSNNNYFYSAPSNNIAKLCGSQTYHFPKSIKLLPCNKVNDVLRSSTTKFSKKSPGKSETNVMSLKFDFSFNSFFIRVNFSRHGESSVSNGSIQGVCFHGDHGAFTMSTVGSTIRCWKRLFIDRHTSR